jgi:hypothetical protein
MLCASDVLIAMHKGEIMAQSLFTLRRMLAVVALTLMVSGATLSAAAAMAESQPAAQPQAGAANRIASSDSEIMAIIAKNIALGIVSTRTTFSGGIYRTVITLANGATIVGCSDKLLNPIPCP